MLDSANQGRVSLRSPPGTDQPGDETPVIVLHTCCTRREAPPRSPGSEGGPGQRKQVISVEGHVIDGLPENEGQLLDRGI